MSDNNIDIEENMKIVKWVWVGLNILLVIYAAVLFVCAKYFRKSEVQNYRNMIEERTSHIENLTKDKIKSINIKSKVMDRYSSEYSAKENLLPKLEKEMNN